MKSRSKWIICSVVILLLLTVVETLAVIYTGEEVLSTADILRRFISAPLIGFFFGLYSSVACDSFSKKLKTDLGDEVTVRTVLKIRVWLKCSFFCCLIFGFVAASSLLLAAKFILDLPFVDMAFVVDAYRSLLIFGFFMGNISYAALFLLTCIHDFIEHIERKKKNIGDKNHD